jgi:uncharacterized membrane protein
VYDDQEAPSSRPSTLPPAARRLFFDLRFAGGRMIVSGVVALIAMLLTPSVPFRVRAVVGWDAGSLVFIVLAWIMILRASPAKTRTRAALEDPGRLLVFVLALGASFFSLFAAVVVLRQIRSLDPEQVPIWTGLALAAVVLSWIVTHTVFTLRYAHLYYRRRATTDHCLQFPGKDPPSDLDFAYFAFTVGMCFQVSDVVVASSRGRRTVLLHALISFVYNTTILALSLNLVTNLLS